MNSTSWNDSAFNEDQNSKFVAARTRKARDKIQLQSNGRYILKRPQTFDKPFFLMENKETEKEKVCYALF